MEFENRVVVVTGASRNIGRAIALAFGRAGANVAVNAVSSVAEAEAVAAEIRAMGRKAIACIADVTKPDAVAQMAAQVKAELGEADVLVLNAAIRPEMPFLEMPYSEWRRVIDHQIDQAFHCTKAFLPGMVARGRGRIITLGGMQATRGAAGRTHVGAAKGALLGFTRSLAAEFGRHGVTANMVAPGSIATSRASREGEARAAAMAQAFHVPRQGLPEEIAGAVLYLASDAAAYVTAQTIHVNGGVVLG